MANSAVMIGSRIECEGARGTVKWIGEIPTTQGQWYGIDWDDAARGRHNGSHNGVKYFETRFPTSGSFVRPTKVSTGISLEAAVRGRYQGDTAVELQVTEQLQRTIKARFVEVVGMDQVAEKQGRLEELDTVILTGSMVWGTDECDLQIILPKLQHLDISNSLLSSWSSVGCITRQLPCLRLLNISGNLLDVPKCPNDLQESVGHITHLVLNNMMVYTWQDFLTCSSMFPKLSRLQVAFNNLKALGQIPAGLFDTLEELDIGVNPIASWEEVNHLGTIPRLRSLNANGCQLRMIKFPSTSTTGKTTLFPSLKHLMIVNNPLETWEATGELNKLASLEELVISYDGNAYPYFHEFTFARIANLKVLNRTRLTPKEKRDCELFYLKSFGNEYYSSGGNEDGATDALSEDFTHKHPGYAQLVKDLGPPMDETSYNTQKRQKLKNLKIELKIITPDHPEREEYVKTFLPSIKVAKVKMMLKRQLKINPALPMRLSYSCCKGGKVFEVVMDNDMQEMAYYSIQAGDTLLVRW
ncbi:tubulin-specific chaperone E-like [Procambarus clarkii]|uniref:tubulin-specific chaperone E-like n=1 Tax=Procambarus clarkii TaxID=6728 RepID=UPI001E672A6B|nr:tubulin-specific chaperone E-like [Procambarus clarkii]